jgi:hypothetical protein
MEDSQKKGMGAKSGGQKIDDHSFWAGKRSAASPFPDGPHKEKQYVSAEGAGNVMKYEDTSEAIKKMQDDGQKKAKAHQGRLPEYRN